MRIHDSYFDAEERSPQGSVVKLQQRTEYALRALMLLATNDRHAREIADLFELSPSHLSKVMQTLTRHGWVNASRGRGKKATLARPAKSITVGEVVRALEPLDLADCYRGISCRLEGDCALEQALARAWEAFACELDDVALSELIHSPTLISLTRANEMLE